jgi:hypothetical protein
MRNIHATLGGVRTENIQMAEHLRNDIQASKEACSAVQASMEAQLEQLKHHLSNENGHLRLQQQTLECNNRQDAELLQRVAEGHTRICLAVEELQPLVQHQQQRMAAAEKERLQQATQQAVLSRDVQKELTHLASEFREQVPSNLRTWMTTLEGNIAQLHGRDKTPELEAALQELKREHGQLANLQRRQAMVVQGFESDKQAFEDALDAEATRRCALVADLHARLAREIAEVQRQVELVRVGHDATAGIAIGRNGEKAAPAQLQQDVQQLMELFEAERRERINDTATLRDEANLALQAEREGRVHDLQELRSALDQSLDEKKRQLTELAKAVQNQREKEDESTQGQQASVLDCSRVSSVPVLERPSLLASAGRRKSEILSPVASGEGLQSPQSSATPKLARVLEDGAQGSRLRPHTARDWPSGSRNLAEASLGSSSVPAASSSDWQSLLLRPLSTHRLSAGTNEPVPAKVIEEGSLHEDLGMQPATDGVGSGGSIGSPTRANVSGLLGSGCRAGGSLTKSNGPLFYAYAKQQQQQLPQPQEGGATC